MLSDNEKISKTFAFNLSASISLPNIFKTQMFCKVPTGGLMTNATLEGWSLKSCTCSSNLVWLATLKKINDLTKSLKMLVFL